MIPQQTFEEPLSSSPIALGLQIDIDHFAIPKALAALTGQALLVHRSPKIMLLAIDSDKNFINEKGVAEAAMITLQSTGINVSEFETPEAD